MGEDIFVGDLQKEIMLIDGVISLIDFSVYSIYDGYYSSDRCPLPEAGNGNAACNTNVGNIFKVDEGANSFKIDLNAIDNVLYSDYNSMYEVLNDSNIQVRAKLI